MHDMAVDRPYRVGTCHRIGRITTDEARVREEFGGVCSVESTSSAVMYQY